jgi:hypothetical protein
VKGLEADSARNTPIAAANKVLTKDIPWIVNSVDRMLTGGRVGYVCGYIFSPRTPLIMVPFKRYPD